MDFIELDGLTLRYELSGKGDRTLVLVHEMGGSLESWDDVAPRFAESRRVLRYDTRGAGMSQKVRGQLGIDTMADDIAALLDALGIVGRVALAGIAVGGAIALHFAARHSERTSAVAVGSPAIGIAPDRRAAVSASHSRGAQNEPLLFVRGICSRRCGECGICTDRMGSLMDRHV